MKKSNSIKSETFSQINTKAEIITDPNEPKEEIEIFFSLVDSNTIPNYNYSINLGLITKNSKSPINLGTTKKVK